MPISSQDLLISPLGKFYKVLSSLENDCLLVRPMDCVYEMEEELRFTIPRNFLIEHGWKKKL